MDREFFKAKILCAIHQAKERNFILTPARWWVIVNKNGIYELDAGRASPLDIIIEGKRGSNYSRDLTAARVLGVSESIISEFINGLCGMTIPNNRNDELLFVYKFGCECRAICA